MITKEPAMVLSLTRRLLVSAAFATLAPTLPAVAEPGVLRVAAPWEYTSNEPSDTGYIMARMQIAETLVMVEPDGKLVGGIAEKWSVAEDRLTWRFPIRNGLTFHDGSPVTADAAVRSLRLAFAGESMQQIPVDEIKADGNALVIRTKTPFSHLPAVLVDYAAVILAPASYGPDGKVVNVIGSGPFKIAKIDGKTVLELDRFDGYRGGPAKIAKARYTAIPNGDTRTNVAVAGDQDIIFTTVPSATPRIDAAGQMKVASVTIPRIRVMAFNSGIPQFEDARVRRAISMGIDRQGIASAVLRHPGSAATQLIPPMLTEWHNPALSPNTRDVAGARALLDQAGWTPAADGVRARNGVRLSAKLLTIANRPELTVIGQAMQAQLKDIGVEISVDPVPFANIGAAIRDGTMQATMIARTYVNVPEVIATIIPDFTRERSNWGTLNWPGRDRIKVLTDEYVQSFDETRKQALRMEITRIIHEETPVTAVAWFEHTVAVSSRVQGLAIDPYETRYMLHNVTLK
jgi:peptide/nickel transport system substrate-binding protein